MKAIIVAKINGKRYFRKKLPIKYIKISIKDI